MARKFRRSSSSKHSTPESVSECSNSGKTATKEVMSHDYSAVHSHQESTSQHVTEVSVQGKNVKPATVTETDRRTVDMDERISDNNIFDEIVPVAHEDFESTINCTPQTSNTEPQEEQDNKNHAQSIFPTPKLPWFACAPSIMDTTSVGSNLDDSGHPYVGLVNQAMTCYLNSLIQTLYMTPEFRTAVYEWQFKGDVAEESRSIPRQLQKLFLLLQTSDRESLETRDLTGSFGWSGGEAYDQHDVQELCRIMFDALEQKWRKTKNSSLIQDLYRGTMEDFVKCLVCRKESIRTDYFLDLPLAVKQFGAVEAFKSVEEALQAFIKPEVLDGNNQYFCDRCKRKQNALKGLRITHFPYLLTIQLKRFDFDYTTLHRIKLNDKMTFPHLLNLNEFVYDESKEPKKTWAAAVTAPKSNMKSAPPQPKDYVARAEQQTGRIDPSEVEEILTKEGPYVYELFSVMVHQGSAAGGHYFAYIKNMDQGLWFCFNDSNVTAATIDEIRRTFGGSSGWSGGWSMNNTNAYMLMYRQIDRSRNAKFIKTVDLPAHLKEQLNRWELEEKEKIRQREYVESLVHVYVMYNEGSNQELSEEKRHVRLPYNTKLMDLFNEALSLFKHQDMPDASNIRLLYCKNCNYDISRSFTDEELNEMTLLNLNPSLMTKFPYRPDMYFMLDVKPPEMLQFYEVHETASETVKVIGIDIENVVTYPPMLIQFQESEKIVAMKAKIGQLFTLPPLEVCSMRMIIDKGITNNPTLLLLDNNEETFGNELKRLATTAYNIAMFVDASSGHKTMEDRRKEFQLSVMYKILERKKHGIVLPVLLPSALDFKQAGLTIPCLLAGSRSTTPMTNSKPENAFTGSSCNGTHNLGTTYPTATAFINTTAVSSHFSSTSSNISDDEKEIMDSCSSSISPACTPMVSPSVSDTGDANYSDDKYAVENQEKYERTFAAVMAFSEQSRLNDKNGLATPADAREDDTLGGSSADTVTGGTQTAASVRSCGSLNDIEVLCQTDVEIAINVDGRISVKQLKEWLSDLLSLDAGQFALIKHFTGDEEGYETNANDVSQVQESFGTVKFISIKLRSPLKANEKLIRIVRMELESPDVDKWPTLFEIAVTAETKVRDLLEKCREMLETHCQIVCDVSRLRIRDMVSGYGLPMLSPSDKLGYRGQQFNKTVYLQILTGCSI
ncbi:hypothetical protein AB6A40_007153 [Gnathostoma spinigerum]|uniref:USP domain-containing protein n=1 Tax=Gnathostoma spinigerum TaxID=75299 RepID=A0ABD6EKE9_9BILA